MTQDILRLFGEAVNEESDEKAKQAVILTAAFLLDAIERITLALEQIAENGR